MVHDIVKIQYEAHENLELETLSLMGDIYIKHAAQQQEKESNIYLCLYRTKSNINFQGCNKQ